MNCEGRTSLEISEQSQIALLSARYAAKGLHRAVLDTAAKQIEKEEETRALAPNAYRLSQMSEDTVRTCYRGGKDHMSSSDLVRYIDRTRAERIRTVDFSADSKETVESADGSADASLAVETSTPQKPTVTQRLGALSRRAGKGLAERLPVWFDLSTPDSSHETHRFPISAFAAILAVAMSLMLIVASSVLLTRAESGINELREEIDLLAAEVDEMQADFEVQHDMLEIYRIATEEYGMVSEEYLKTYYLSFADEDSVQVYEDKGEGTINLAAILSAIGIK